MVLIEANVKGYRLYHKNCLSGLKDIVIERINGHLFEKMNIEDFANKLRRILTNKLNFARSL